MATIQGTIKLIDQFSPALRAILDSIDQTVTAMEQLDTVSSDAFVGARDAIDAARKSVDDLDTAVGKVGKDNIPEVEDEAQKVKKAFGEWNPTLLNVSAALNIIQTGIGAIRSGWSAVTGLLDTSDTQTMAETQLGTVMANMGGTYEGYKNVKTAASGMQSKTTFSDESMLAGAAEIGTYLSDADAIAALLPTLADYAAGMGGPEASAEQMTQYATNLAKTFVGSFDAMNEKGFVFDDAQKKIMETGTEMEKVAVLNEVIGEGWGGLAEQFAATPQGQMIQLENTLNNMKETMGAQLYPYVQMLVQAIQNNLPIIQSALSGITAALQGIISFVATNIIPGIATVATWISQNANTIKSVLVGISAALIVVAAAFLISKIAATGFFATLLASPITWIALAIGLVIYVIYQWIQSVGGIQIAWMMCKNALATTWDAITLAFKTAVTNIKNWLDNMSIKFHTSSVEVQNFMGDMKVGVLNILQTMVNGAIDIINKFIGLLNEIPGVNISLIDQVTFGTKAAAVNEAAKAARESELASYTSELQQQIDERNKELARQEHINQIKEKTRSRLLEDAKDALNEEKQVQSTEDAVANIFDGNVKVTNPPGESLSTTGEVSLADEDLKYILDATERRYISYVNLEPTAPFMQVNFGDVRETADVEQIQDYLADTINKLLPVTSAYAGAEANP